MQTDWPGHSTETLPWSSQGRGPKEDRIFSEYQATIPPFIAGLDWPQGAETSALSDEAVAAVVRLDATAGQVLAPLTGFLLRNEAQSSSKIERVQASQIDLARASLGIKANEDARTTVAAAEAISLLINSVANTGIVDLQSLLASHYSLMREDKIDAEYAGKLRTVQNWIGGSDYTPRNAIHVPPAPERVPELMDDLVAFCNRRDLPVMAQAALAHAQFESIHPFTDGNGRIGRALINAELRFRGTTGAAIIPLASAFAARRQWYFSLINVYRQGYAGLFVQYLCRCAVLACEEAAASAETLSSLPSTWRESAPARGGSAVERMIDDLLDAPLLTIETVVDRLGVSRTAATSAISRLEDAGVLRFVGRGRRDQAWAAGDVLDETESLVLRIEEGRARLLTPAVERHLISEGLIGV
ncbi:Fic family protein [Citricoccus sp. GCM10030269]|uniref:Fic family protein n=1 Tax=Citricoccus sp. GCM10030269 TaxID=3273388 RepID=UPI00361BA722